MTTAIELHYGDQVKLKDGRCGVVKYLLIDPERPGERWFEAHGGEVARITAEDVEEFLDR